MTRPPNLSDATEVADAPPDAVARRAGVLVLIGTPIGNLGDLSPRAIDELGRADVVACEDTRRTGKLLAHIGVRAPKLLVVNDHTEAASIPAILQRVGRGERVAVVSDAGMPGISDPGERLVQAATAAGVAVEVVPGPSAAVTGLVLSGLAAGRFVFEGFLPRKGSGRTARLRELAGERRTVVLYEAPHRVARTIHDLRDVMGPDRRVALARELTKLHEEVWRGTLEEAIERVGAVEPRGEYVVVLEGAPAPGDASDDDLRDALARHRAQGSTTKDAVAAVADEFAVPRKRAYALATEAGRGDPGSGGGEVPR